MPSLRDPAPAALILAALAGALAASAAFVLWGPDTAGAGSVALAVAGLGGGGAVALVVARRHRRRYDSEMGWVTRALEREGLLGTIVSSLHEGLIFYDRDQRILEFNPAAERILGMSDQAVGTRPLELPGWQPIREDGTPWPVDEQPLITTLRTGEPVIGAVQGIERAGQPVVWIRLNAQPVRGAGRAVEGVILTFSDITEQRDAEAALRVSQARAGEATEALQWQAHHDPLTRLPNRALLLERLTAAIEGRHDHGAQTALLFLDLDRFKNVNDTLGHDAGDQLLIEVANRLRTVVRPSDTVARLGGDEFVVLVEALRERDEAARLAHRLRAAIAEPITIDHSVVTITTSVGIAFDVDHRASTLVRDADTALYKAKDQGRDRWAVYDDSLRAATVRRVAAEQILRQGLDEDGLRVHYQPVVELATGRVVGIEALLRMQGPTDDLLMPSSFMHTAEETGLIVPLGSAVLDDACHQLTRWRRELGDDAPAAMAVNVAARQLSARGFGELVLDVVDRHGLAPTDLVLELTESVLIAASRDALDAVVTLHEAGVRLAIDDFGTGYSSLSYLKRFPVDIVKVDRSFVDGLGTTSSDTEIVRAVLALGHALELVTVAEGVETAEQLRELQALGCQQAQGYLFSRPVPADEVAGAIERINRGAQPA